LPYTFAHSTIGPAGLNFRVRDGNGWNPRGKITAKLRRFEGVSEAIAEREPSAEIPSVLRGISASGFYQCADISQVLPCIFPAQGTLHVEEPKLVKEREHDRSQLNRLKPLEQAPGLQALVAGFTPGLKSGASTHAPSKFYGQAERAISIRKL